MAVAEAYARVRLFSRSQENMGRQSQVLMLPFRLCNICNAISHHSSCQSKCKSSQPTIRADHSLLSARCNDEDTAMQTQEHLLTSETCVDVSNHLMTKQCLWLSKICTSIRADLCNDVVGDHHDHVCVGYPHVPQVPVVPQPFVVFPPHLLGTCTADSADLPVLGSALQIDFSA